ncbi:uncharacterized protein LOC117317195 [Pecten maximus]|uniref:uncharacterized protein LOC117317195 n=1 Tax=Pecten maximus TaxID=6579 RepID=UPI0014583C54|nr:uncharacterized protein LOC117317195 [Pecten maximus]
MQTSVGNRMRWTRETEDVENKVSFLRDQLKKNENQVIIQREVDKIRDRGRILKEQVDALVTEFETKYYELKSTRTEHIKKIEAEYSSFLIKLKAESAKCEDVCKSGSLQEVEGIIKSLDELLNHTSLPNIELHDDFFEPVQTTATELKDLFGKMCGNEILIPDRGDELLDKADEPDVDMADDSDIASLLDSEHGATPKSTSIQEDIASEKSFIPSETSARSYHGDFDDVENSIRDPSIISDISAREAGSDKLPQVSSKKLSAQSGSDDIESEIKSIQSEVISTPGEPVSDREIAKSVRPVKSSDELKSEPSSKHSSEDDRKSVAKSDKSAAEDFVEEDLDVTDTSHVLEKEDDRNIMQDTEDEPESEKSKYSYASSSEEVANSKSSSLPKSKDAADILSKDVVTKDIDERSLIGDSDHKDDGRGSETSLKDEEFKLEQNDSLSSETGKPAEDVPIQISMDVPLGQDSSNDKAKFKTDHGQLGHSSDTEVADGKAKGKPISKDDWRDSEKSMKDEEIKLDQDDSQSSETGQPVKEVPIQVTVEIPLGQDSIDDKPKLKTDHGMLDQSSDTEVTDGKTKDKVIPKALSHSVPVTQERKEIGREANQDQVKIEEVHKDVSKEYPKGKRCSSC